MNTEVVEVRRSREWWYWNYLLAWLCVCVGTGFGLFVVGNEVVALYLGLYMMPWVVATGRRSRNDMVVLLINVTIGWTIIGWIAAMALALAPHEVVGVDE